MVSETNAEIKTAPATTMPNSRKRLPTKPSRKITGRNTIASVADVETTAKKISFDPSRAACRMGIPCSSFRKMFSVTTIPSSTTSPVASTIPSKVRMLIEKPARYMMKKVAMSEIGISISGRRAIFQLRKKKKMTSTTRENAINSVSSTSSRERRTFRVLSISVLN